jgi:indole-3-glycerol phosphate synthase
MSDILHRILATKKEELIVSKSLVSQSDIEVLAHASLTDPILAPRGFIKSIEAKIALGHAGVIAEIKQASPSRGILRDPFHPALIDQSYAEHGAACLSVLTDEQYFKGCTAFLKEARSACSLPVIRKDFMVDPYQIFEARSMGADAILLIVSALSDQQLKEFEDLAIHLQMDVLVEVHGAEELQRALLLKSSLLGINNRDLKTFEVSLQNTINLLSDIPKEKRIVTESGILAKKDVDFMREHHVDAFLVGEAFMRAENPGQALQDLFF